MQLKQSIDVDVNVTGANKVDALAGSLSKMEQETQKAGRSASNASKDFSQVETALARLERRIITIAAEWITFKAALGGLEASDNLRDLETVMGNIAGGAQKAAQTMQFFWQVQRQTNATVKELAESYNALYKNAVGRGGFTPEGLQRFVVELANAGHAIGKNTDEMTRFWTSVQSGVGKVDKNILNRLGLTKEGAQDVREVAKAVEDFSRIGEQMGLDLTAVFNKVGEAWAHAFVGMDKDAEADKGNLKLLKTLTSPDILQGIQRIGSAVLLLLSNVDRAANLIGGAIQSTFGLLKTAVFGILELITKAMQKFTTWIAGFVHDNPILKGGSVDSFLQGAIGKINEISAAFQGLRESGVADFNAGNSKLAKAFSDSKDEAEHFNLSLGKLINNLHSWKDTTKEVTRENRKWIEDMQAMARGEEEFAALQNRLDKIMGRAESAGSPLDRLMADKEAEFKSLETAANMMLAKYGPVAMEGTKGGYSQERVQEAERMLVVLHQFIDALPDLLDQAGAAVGDAYLNNLKIANQRAAANLADEYSKISVRMVKDFGVNPSDPFGQAAYAGFAQFSEQYPALVQKVNDAKNDKEREAAKLAATEYLRAFETGSQRLVEAGQQFKQIWTDPVGGVIATLAQGGSLVGTLIGTFFVNAVKDGSNKLADVLGGVVLSAFGAGPKTQMEGESDSDFQKRMTRQKNILQGVQGVVGAGAQAYNLLSSAQQGKQVSGGDIASSIIGFTAAGASIGGYIGAIVGAVVGTVIAVIAKETAKSKLPYAQFGIENGQAFVRPDGGGYAGSFANLTKLQINDMMQQLQRSFDEARNGFIKILLKFPLDVIAGMNIAAVADTITPTITKFSGSNSPFWKIIKGLATGGWYQNVNQGPGWNTQITSPGELPAAGGSAKEGGGGLRSFQSDFDNWVKNTLPQRIAEQFHDRVAQAFGAMGMTVTQFDKVWKQLQGMDPKEARQILSDMADALVGFDKLQKQMRNITHFNTAFAAGSLLNADGSIRGAGVNDFSQKIQDAAEGMAKLALAVVSMTGADQVTAAKQLSDSMGNVMKDLIDYLNQITQISKQLSQAVQDEKEKLTIAHLSGNPNAQSKFLYGELTDVQNQIRNAQKLGLNPEDIQRLTQRGISIVDQLQALDPEGRYQWAQSQLDYLNSLQRYALQQMGEQARNQVSQLIATMQPAVDFFKGTLVDLADAAQNAATALNGGADTHTPSRQDNTPDTRGDWGASGTRVEITVDDPNGFVRGVRQRRVATR